MHTICIGKQSKERPKKESKMYIDSLKRGFWIQEKRKEGKKVKYLASVKIKEETMSFTT